MKVKDINDQFNLVTLIVQTFQVCSIHWNVHFHLPTIVNSLRCRQKYFNECLKVSKPAESARSLSISSKQHEETVQCFLDYQVHLGQIVQIKHPRCLFEVRLKEEQLWETLWITGVLTKSKLQQLAEGISWCFLSTACTCIIKTVLIW